MLRITEWSRASRRLSQNNLDGFFGRRQSVPVLFRFRTSDFDVPAHGGDFSLKLVLSGAETYGIGGRRIRIRAGQLLCINEGETYSSSIDEPTESISIFVPVAEAASAIRSAQDSAEALASDPDTAPGGLDVPQFPYRIAPRASAALASMCASMAGDDECSTEDYMYAFLGAALSDLYRVSPPNSLNDVRKKSTRDELRGRLARAKTAIDDTEGQFADLDDLAAVACLSKYYFLRLFADVYGLGAGAYARRKRMEAARDFLERGGSLDVASQTSGYRDTRSFARAYLRIIGRPIPGPH